MYDAQFYRTRTDFGCLGTFSAKTRLHFTAQEVLYHHNITKATTDLRIECYNNRVNGIETRPGVNCAGVCSPQAKTV